MSRIQEIKAEIAKLQAELLELEGSNVITVMAETNSLVKAAEKLDMSRSQLTYELENSDVPHLYGESWAVACRRYLAQDTPRDNYTYPEPWVENVEKIAGLVSKKGLKEASITLLEIGKTKGYFPENTKTILNVLGRFLQINGYDKQATFVGVPEWMN